MVSASGFIGMLKLAFDIMPWLHANIQWLQNRQYILESLLGVQMCHNFRNAMCQLLS